MGLGLELAVRVRVTTRARVWVRIRFYFAAVLRNSTHSSWRKEFHIVDHHLHIDPAYPLGGIAAGDFIIVLR